MVKNRIKTMKKGIPIVFAVLALAFFIGSAASVSAADQGWYDSQAWFSSGGNLPNESDWYNATYGPGQRNAYYGNQGYWHDQENPGRMSRIYSEEPYASPATPNYYGSYPTQPGFSKLNPGASSYDYYGDRSYRYSEDRTYYQDPSRPGSLTRLNREEPNAPPATPNYYGNYPTQPGFSKMEYSEDHGRQQRTYNENIAQRDPSEPGSLTELSREAPNAPPATPNYYGNFPTQPGFAKLRTDDFETTYGYYEESMTNQPHYYTRDWGSRGEFEAWY